MEEEDDDVKMFCGTCPDSHCGNLLYFISNISTDVECTNCGQRHATSSLLNLKRTDGTSAAVGSLLKSMLLNNSSTKKGTELVKVRGLSNYHCKLISPLLTSYGMDKNSGKPKLLSELGQPEVFDCSVLGNRAFLIEKEHLEIDGYGKDKTGSLIYLGATLELIDKANDYKTCLVPLHADGDGHCLVHAISKAVVGRELLWHSLRQNLRDHLEQENAKYKGLFQDFIGKDEWSDIIAEADPEYYPETNEPFGLRNIHVFGLANVLHRPIILLDSTEGMQSSGDYSGIFLPALLPVDKCKSQGVLNKPLVIAWSSSARNHYVPLVGVKGFPLPKIPQSLLPKAWGLPEQLVSTYIDFDDNSCLIGGSRSLPESYIERLVSAMNEVFFERHHVSPQLVSDVNQFICKPSNALGMTLGEVTEFTQQAMESNTLYRCLSCQAVNEAKEEIPRSLREPGGKLYKIVEGTEEGLRADAFYSFTNLQYPPCIYDVQKDILKPFLSPEPSCELCKGALRQVRADGTVKYDNGDRTLTPSVSAKRCCGFKHYWNGKEYDNIPKSISVPLEWNGKKIEETVFWFELESDPGLNSNAYEIATSLVQKHFPGVFGSEVLVRQVVDKILRETAVKGSEDEGPPQLEKKLDDEAKPTASDVNPEASPSKIILTGPKKKTLHKEELNKNDAEKLTNARIKHHAAYSQKRKNASESAKAAGSSKQGKQEVPKEKPKQSSLSASGIPRSSAPQPMVSGSAGNLRECKIRLSSSDGRQVTVTLAVAATYQDLQEAVVTQFGIPKDRQKFRYGFPPRELKPPEDRHSVLPLSHGDHVKVEELPEKMEQEEQESRPEDLPDLENMEVTSELNAAGSAEEGTSSDHEGVDREKLASDLMNLLRGALNMDRWEEMQHRPELFARRGYIYEKVVGELGPLRDDQHCSISELPGKTFAYNAKEDRLEICLGQKHLPIQPLDPVTSAEAHNRTGEKNPLGTFPALRNEAQGLGAFSGALRHRDASAGRSAFSGMGRTLGGSGACEDQKRDEGKETGSGDVSNMDDVSMKSAMPSEEIEEIPMVIDSASDNVTGTEGGEELVVNTGEEGQQSENQMSTDVEMKLSVQDSQTKTGSDLLVSREGTSVEHDGTLATRDATSVARDDAIVARDEASVTHDETSVTHDETSFARDATSVAHERTSIAHEETSINIVHNVGGAGNVTANVEHEMSAPVHVTSVTHGLPSTLPESTDTMGERDSRDFSTNAAEISNPSTVLEAVDEKGPLAELKNSDRDIPGEIADEKENDRLKGGAEEAIAKDDEQTMGISRGIKDSEGIKEMEGCIGKNEEQRREIESDVTSTEVGKIQEINPTDDE